MGADLIALVYFGPSKLEVTPAIMGKAVQHAKTIKDLVVQLNATFDTDAWVDAHFEETLLAVHAIDDKMDADAEWCEAVLEYEPEIVVRNFIQLWNGETSLLAAKDFVVRSLPDDPARIVMVAGGTTWGDDPEGIAYEALQRAKRLGVLKFFGIT